MRYTLLDRITVLEPGKRIEAIKGLSLSEEYLGDHFPLFPVMPGVFMLEALTQASAWLIRASEGFAHSMVLLEEARNVKYADFVGPGQLLVVKAEILSHDGNTHKLQVVGTVGENTVVSARLVMRRYNLSETQPSRKPTDVQLIRHLRQLFEVLCTVPA
jgi:3-hydroxyacyl-[acyl-carrier-protein] dehydratase